MPTTKIKFGSIEADVERKDIKNVHLSVHPPSGHVTISAPARMKLDTFRVFAISKLDWIKKQQRKIREQEREMPRDYLERESHYVWGKRYLLSVHEEEARPRVELKANRLKLHVRPGASEEKREEVVTEYYRTLLKKAIPPLIAKWEKEMGVTVAEFTVRRMKTRWGSCTPAKRTIRLNVELAKKPRRCLEYLVVHEMAHLLEPTHNQRFVSLMDQYMPDWRNRRDALNRLPVRQERWKY